MRTKSEIWSNVVRLALILATGDGITTTGNKVEIYEASIYRLEKGKIVEQVFERKL